MTKLSIDDKQTILHAAQLVIEANKLLISNNVIFEHCAKENKELRVTTDSLIKKVSK